MIIQYCKHNVFSFKLLIHTQALVYHLKNCSKLQDVQSVQASMIKTNATHDCYLMNQFITACSSLHRMEYALLAFAQVDSPNVLVYNSLIRGFVQCSLPIRALELYLEALRAQVGPTSYTFSLLIKACSVISAMWFGQAVQCQVLRNGFQSHVFVQTALIDFYGSLGRSVESTKVFDEMPERDPFAWTTMVSIHARNGDMCSATKLFDKMSVRNTTTWNTMIDGYSRLGDIESASSLFKQMGERDSISWTTMITCYSWNKKYREALAIFNDMINDRVWPDEVTVATVVSCCAHLGALDLGKQVHFVSMQQGLCLDVYIGSALIDMYAKCGSLDRSLVVFYKLREKNLFCWNAVIEGLAVHGYAKKALSMFHRMLSGNIKPNGITFISILSACTHAGLVEVGREMFLSMTHDFFISPEIEHYGCMVDLLCRAGLLEDALEVIRGMKLEPNSVIWGVILSSCKQCKNLEIAEFAVRKLMILEPDNCGYYTLLVNMYAEANRWNAVARIRATMKQLGVEKQCPGSSWIEMDCELHHFAAADKSHSSFGEIHLLLDELDGQLKLSHVSELEPIS